MRKHFCLKTFTLTLLFSTIFLFIFINPAYANNIGGGSEPAKPQACTSAYKQRDSEWGGVVYGGTADAFNCCSPYHEQCPRWILVSKEDFAKAWNNRHSSTVYNAYQSQAEICMNSEQGVIMAGVLNAWWVSKKANSDTLGLYNNISVNKKKIDGNFSYNYIEKQFVNLRLVETYHNGESLSWSDLLSLYKGDEFSNEADVSFFCPGLLPSTYASISNAGSDSGYVTTGIATATTTKTWDTSAAVDEDIHIRYSHNIYASQSKESVPWMHSRPSFSSYGTKITIKESNLSNYPYNPANLTEKDKSTGYYAATNRTATDGQDHFIARDEYTVSFSAPGTYTLCESIEIDGQNWYTEACINIEVTEAGSSPWTEDPNTCGDETTVSVLQRNANSSKFSNWTTDKIYAKPQDQINYIYNYCSGVQSHANETVTVSEGSHGCSDTTNYNDTFSSAISWGNYYEINRPNMTQPWRSDDFGTGKIVSKNDSGNYMIQTTDVGQIRTSTITSSTPISAWSQNDGVHTWSLVCSYTCACGCTGKGCVDPHNCACSPESHNHTNDYYSYSYVSGPATESVNVRIPYNYIINNGNVNIESSNPIYAGETIQLENISFSVGPKYSNILEQTYATKTQPATVTLYALWFTYDTSYRGGNVQGGDFCTYYNYSQRCDAIDFLEVSDGFNANSNKVGLTEKIFDGDRTYSVYDIPAGSQFCLGFEINHAESNDDPNTDSDNGYNYISTLSCRVVAKEPTFQVWGGSIYANNFSLNTMNKTNLYNNFAEYFNETYGYKGKNITISRYYSSWVELSVSAPDDVNANTIASGAGSGYNANDNGELISDPGGSDQAISNLNRLMIPNVTGTTSSNNKTFSSTKDSLIAQYVNNELSKKISSSGIDLSDSNNYSETTDNVSKKTIRRTSVTSSDGISTNVYSEYPLPAKTTHIISSENNIIISGNLFYKTNYNYTSLLEIPQYIIYAKNIYIGCKVTEIHAILIADDEINTCAEDTADDAAMRSNQLKIHGAIFAKTLILGRTYGAGIGKNSEIPAEIIDIDPTTYLWGASEATQTSSLTTTYMRELSPRY